MSQYQHLGVVNGAKRNAEKIGDVNIDRHLHAVDGTAQHDGFAVKFDLPHAAVGAGIMGIEADRKGERVEPQCAARPGGIDPACCSLTPHGLVSPPGFCSRSMRGTLPYPAPKWL